MYSNMVLRWAVCFMGFCVVSSAAESHRCSYWLSKLATIERLERIRVIDLNEPSLSPEERERILRDISTAIRSIQDQIEKDRKEGR